MILCFTVHNMGELFWKQIAACRLIEDSGEELKCVNAAADKISDGMRICRTEWLLDWYKCRPLDDPNNPHEIDPPVGW